MIKTQVSMHHRSDGYHSFIQKCVIPVEFNDIYIKEDSVNEQLLVDSLPDKFLFCKPSQCLLLVEDEDRSGNTGQRGLHIFRNWAKYFPSYSITISRVMDDEKVAEKASEIANGEEQDG